MSKRKRKKHIHLTTGEEIANCITHGVPAVLIIFLIPTTAIFAWERNGIKGLIGITIFNFSMFFMFLMSTLYHSMEHDSKHKEVFHILDHIGIFIAIAGSYTPVALSVFEGWQAIVLLSIQWILVIFGILTKSLAKNKAPRVSLALYLIMGWTLVLFMPTFIKNSSPTLFWLMTGGGILYTIGSVFYAKKGFKYWHMIFHIFVLLGAAAQYIGICFFI